MGDCKNKRIVQKENPIGKHVERSENPYAYYKHKPAWNFNSCDKECWTFSKESMGDLFWTSVLPRLKNLETQTWEQILVSAKKQNHSIDFGDLNPVARKRVLSFNLEAESIDYMFIPQCR